MDNAIREMMAHYGVTDEATSFLSSEPQMYVDGRFGNGESNATIEVVEPSTACYLTSIPAATEEDIDRAVAAANRALVQGPWATMKPNERQRILLKLADLIERDAQIIGEIETIDNGKALGPCIEMDVLGGADLLRYMAGFSTKIEGSTRSVSAPGEHIAMTFKEPIGVVAAIVPWNWPFNMAMWKLSAPLAVGCTMVLKPAQQTSLSMIYFARLCEEAGLPPGVLNIVTGSGSKIGSYLVAHPGVNKVSFTGSTPVGRMVGEAAGRSLSPATLELGGKSPMVAFADADFDALAEATRWSVFFNAGQVCSAGSRLYVERSSYDQAIDAICKVTDAMNLCPGLDPDCDIGPVVSAEQQRSILNYLDVARDEGATFHTGGEAVRRDGFFVAPAVLGATDNQLRIVQEEIFGPVLVVLPFDDEEEALRLANDNPFGLAASVWTADIHRAMRVMRELEAGTVWINAHDLVDSAIPCGGVKASGFGKDMGPEQLDYFLKSKAVWLNIG
jgi:phenylacetaldehyde dehydrogenase